MATLFEHLIGTWELVSYSDTDGDGTVGYPLGRDATGYIMYTADGHMSVGMMRASRPAYASGDLHAGTEHEMSAAAAGYLAYAGPFTVDEDALVVRHHVRVSLFPNWLGQTLERACELAGDSLVLSAPPTRAAGAVTTPRIEWRRVPAA